MKIVHWVIKNGSGMCNVALGMADAERALGLPSIALSCDDKTEIQAGKDADIHVVHTHLPDCVDTDKVKIVWVAHGTPEHCFETSLTRGVASKTPVPDSWMISMHMLKMADVTVTFWPRHHYIWSSLADRRSIVECIPMGIDTDTFQPPPEGAITAALAGKPSVAMLENSHAIKWPLDFLLAWPEVSKRLPGAKFHIFNQPLDQVRWWNSLMTRNGSIYRSYVSNQQLPTRELLQVFHGVDFLLSPVRYGDFNRLSLEAAAAGCKVISFKGNPYSNYWLPEGDQREQAETIYQILAGNVAELVPEKKPASNMESAQHMKALYERIG